MPRELVHPTSLAELRPLVQSGALAVAGGALTFNRLEIAAEVVADISRIEVLQRVTDHDSGLTLGGAVLLSALLELSSVPPALKAALTRAVSPHVLNRASISESLRERAYPLLREWITALAALDAGVEVYYAETDARLWINMDALLAGEADRGVIIGLFLPHLGAQQALAAEVVSRTPADIPIVNVAALIAVGASGTVEQAAVAIGGASSALVTVVPLPILAGGPLNEATIASAAKSVLPALAPVSDFLGSAEYRLELARVLTVRALAGCQRQLASG